MKLLSRREISCLRLVNSIPDEIWFADKYKKLTLANPSAVKEFGLASLGKTTVEEIAGNFEVYRADGSIRPVEEAPPLRALKGEIIKNELEIVNTPVNAEKRFRQVNSVPVRDSKGDIIASVSVVRDITEIKKAEETLKEVSTYTVHFLKILRMDLFSFNLFLTKAVARMII